MGHKNLCAQPSQSTGALGSDAKQRGHRSTKGFSTAKSQRGHDLVSDFNCSSSDSNLPSVTLAPYWTRWETIPPTPKAATHVPIQMMNPSFSPRSFIMTIREAMHGTKSVIVMRATVICIGVSGRW